ncbi:MAG: hypothetical protein AABX03_00665 [Nanoarchaeota archaeon]
MISLETIGREVDRILERKHLANDFEFKDTLKTLRLYKEKYRMKGRDDSEAYLDRLSYRMRENVRPFIENR